MAEHHPRVKFVGHGYRAYCTTCTPTWFGTTHQFFKYMGRGQQAALRKAEMLAEQDADRHRRDMRLPRHSVEGRW